MDLETARAIVESEVARALAGAGDHKVSAIVADKVERATRRGERRVKVLTFGVVAAAFAVAVAGVAVHRSQLAAENLAADLGLDRAPAPAPVGTLPTVIVNGRDIYARNKAALYVLGYTTTDRIGGYCTAFAIAPDLLATNAHCVVAGAKEGGTPIAIQNDADGKVRLPIVAMKAHPAYDADSKGADTPDVGLVRIRGKMTSIVTLASDAELRAIGPGDDAYVLGFPGRVMDPRSPTATFLQGRIGRVMGFHEEATTPDQAMLLQHDAVTRGGNSGSPIFNQYGHVIGVHTAHLDEEEDVAIGGKKTTVTNPSPFRIGMRIDLLKGVPAP